MLICLGHSRPFWNARATASTLQCSGWGIQRIGRVLRDDAVYYCTLLYFQCDMRDGAIGMNILDEVYANELIFVVSSLAIHNVRTRALRQRPLLIAVQHGDSVLLFGPTVSIPTSPPIKPNAITRDSREVTLNYRKAISVTLGVWCELTRAWMYPLSSLYPFYPLCPL